MPSGTAWAATAGHAFGNGLGGNGGGGGGVDVAPGASSGAVVNGCEIELLNFAQPDSTRPAAHTAASTP